MTPWKRRWLVRLAFITAIVALAGTAGWFWQKHRDRQAWRHIQDVLARDDLLDASSLLDHHLSRFPDDHIAWFLAARTARRLGRIAEAERFLERCQQLGGVTAATELEWDLMRVQQGNLEGIDSRLRLTVHPDDPDAAIVLEALARGYFKRERLTDAFQACELWLQRAPQNPRPRLWRGWIRERLNHLDNALLDYRQAVEHAPNDLEARLALGNLLLKMRRPGEAVGQFEFILRRSKGHHEALLGLAECRIEQGQAAQAVAPLEQALIDRPDSADGLALRGRAALEQGALTDAEPWLRRAVAADSSAPEPLHALMLCLRAQNKDNEADQLATHVEHLRADLRRLDQLIRDIGRQPNDARPRHEAGVIALRIGRTQEGLRWLEGALRAEGDHRPSHAALADYFQGKGESARAEHHRRLAEVR